MASTAATATQLPNAQWIEAERLYEHRTLMTVHERPSKATPGGMVCICEVMDKDNRPAAQAFLDHKALAKPLSIIVSPERAVERAALVLAGDRESISDFRTLNALATALIYLWHYGDRYERVLRTERPGKADAASGALPPDFVDLLR